MISPFHHGFHLGFTLAQASHEVVSWTLVTWLPVAQWWNVIPGVVEDMAKYGSGDVQQGHEAWRFLEMCLKPQTIQICMEMCIQNVSKMYPKSDKYDLFNKCITNASPQR